MSTGHLVEASFRVGPWLVLPSLNTISRNGTTVQLEPKVMSVLVCLAEHRGEPVSKEQLLQAVWPDTFVGEGVLTRSIFELRRVFEDEAKEPHVIQTIAKRGYRLVAAVTPVHESLPAYDPHPAVPETSHSRRRRLWFAIAGLISLFGALVGFNVGGIRTRIFGGRAPIRSLAVLPLQSLSDDPKQEYLAEGITDALITDFAQIDNLRVVSRTTIMRYGRPDRPLPQIAHELNVDGIVEGTVQRSSNRVRITAQLIYGPSDQHLWAASFDREVKDILTLQSDLAHEIAGQIHVKLSPESDKSLKSLRAVNPKAVDAYAEARFHIDKTKNLTYYKDELSAKREEATKAAFYLDSAIQQDPDYLPAYVAYFDLIDAEDTMLPEHLPKARSAVAKGLQLDESNVAAHLALARLLMQFDYNWSGAEKEYKRAIELNPRSAEAHSAYAEYLDNVEGATGIDGDSVDGARERELAQALDPAHDYYGDNIERQGRTLDEQRRALEEMAPNNPFDLGIMAKDYAVAGRFRESVEMYQRCLVLYGWSDMAEVMKRANATGGPRFALEAWMRAGEARESAHGDMFVVPMAFTYASLGNKDRAFVWLDKAVQQRNWMIIYLKRDNIWDPLRSDPRFTALLKRVGLQP